MSPRVSNLGQIGVGSQGVQKTTAVVPTMFVKYLSDDTGTEFDAEPLEQGGDGKYMVDTVKTQYRETTNFSSYVFVDMAAQLFGALLGKDVPSNLTTTPFHHTITVKTTDLATTPMQPWLTIEKMLTGTTNSGVLRQRAVKLSSITLEGEAGQPVTMSVEGTGLSSAIRTTAGTASYETGNPFSFYHGAYKVNSTTTSCDIKSFSIKLTAENDEENQTCNLTREDIINRKFTAEVTLALNYEDKTIIDKANYAAGTSPTESFSDGSIDINLQTNAATTSEKRLQVVIPKVRLEAHKINLDPSAARLEQPYTGMGLKQPTTDLVTVTVYNNIATTMPL